MIMSFIIGLVLSAGVVYGLNISSAQIEYDNSDSGLTATNIQGAVDELDGKTLGVTETMKFCKYLNSNEVIEEKRSDHLAPGTLYNCTLGKDSNGLDIKEKFYVLARENGTVRMIMEHNLTGENVNINWGQARDIFSNSSIQSGVGTTAKETWTYVLDIDLPRAQDIANAVGNTTWFVGLKAPTDWFYFDKNGNTFGQTRVVSDSNPSNYAWLYNHTSGCQEYGCTSTDTISEVGNTTGTYGYWTRDAIYSTFGSTDEDKQKVRAWEVSRDGTLNRYFVSISFGVRPVITVFESNLYE